MAKQKNARELVWAVKDGFPRRQFTRQQLDAMGTDPDGETHDGWAITEPAKEPEEVKKLRKPKEPEEKESPLKKIADDIKAGTFNKESGESKVVEETKTDEQ